MQQQIEPWELSSGTWLRDPSSETWRLTAVRDGTGVDTRLPAEDVARLIGASRDPASGAWFPPDFRYSQQTGEPLRVAIPTVEFPWVPPFGAPALQGSKSLARSLRLTPRPLALARARQRSARDQPDRMLPPLPPGQYRFVLDKFGPACPTLVAVEPERGDLFMLLPESKRWVALERMEAASWGQRQGNPRGWRMELVHSHSHVTGYCPSASGLAAITPNAMGLSYSIEHAGEGPAVGGAVAWRREIWAPVIGRGHVVHLVGRTHGSPAHLVLPSHAPVPRDGFEAPIFDDLHVNWPCAEGQLVLRLNAHGDKQCEWIPWPEQVKPLFEMGWPYRSASGQFWQLCCSDDGSGFMYLETGKHAPEVASVDALRLCTGHVCYRGTSRVAGDPWHAGKSEDLASTDIVAPLLESAYDAAVIGLRMEAPHGLLALLQAANEPHDAVLQLDRPGHDVVPFGTLHVTRPWLTSLFVHDGHLWVDHPDLRQAPGWELAA